MTDLYIFNPETDEACACGKTYLSLKKNTVRFIHERQLFPVFYAPEESSILVSRGMDISSLPYYGLVESRGLNIVCETDLDWSNINRIIPWGWDKVLKKRLSDSGTPSCKLPSDSEMEYIYELRHRRNGIRLHEMLRNAGVMNEEISIPEEVRTFSEAEFFLRKYGSVCMKSPWSSSGRGVFICKGNFTESEKMRINAVIRQQGSVMLEKAYTVVMDFASEWHIYKGKASFMGFSSFSTFGHGKYNGNVIVSDHDVIDIVHRNCGNPILDDILDIQKSYLEYRFDRYEGPVGIDMLVTDRGNINGCVEINARMTMGLAAIYARRYFPDMKVLRI